jgi:hypothetical protein
MTPWIQPAVIALLDRVSAPNLTVTFATVDSQYGARFGSSRTAVTALVSCLDPRRPVRVNSELIVQDKREGSLVAQSAAAYHSQVDLRDDEVPQNLLARDLRRIGA